MSKTELVLFAELTFLEPAGSELLAALADVMKHTRAEEGCLEYTAHLHAEDQRRVLFHERWADQGCLDRHWASEHLAAFREFVTPRLAAPTTLSFWRKLG